MKSRIIEVIAIVLISLMMILMYIALVPVAIYLVGKEVYREIKSGKKIKWWGLR